MNNDRALGKKIALQLAAVLALLVCASLIMQVMSHSPKPFASVEVAFTDASAHGLAIVPASCPSNPFDADAPYGCSGSSPVCPNGVSSPPNNNVTQCTCAQGNTSQCSSHAICPDGSAAPNNTPSQCTCAQGNTSQCSSHAICPDGSAAPNNNVTQCTCAQGNTSQCGTTTLPHGPGDGPGGPGGGGCSAGQLSQNGQCVNHCDVGYTQQGGYCIANACPIGYQLQGNTCVFVSCPSGYVRQGNSCVISQCTIGYSCVGSNLYYEDSSCVASLVQACSYGCSAGACLPAPAATSSLTASPALVKQSEKSQITWSAKNVVLDSCRVSGSNGDSWSGASGSETSSAISGQVIYTLACTGLDDSAVTKQVTVNVVPVFNEP